ncbi:MAG TPA: hypothetical protein VFR97_08530 [Capillimicrobium sp.]|nr:hypothetical protein [Capillimicrobium sp.]
MRKLILVAASAAALTAAAPALAEDPTTPTTDPATKSAAKLCKEQRASMGVTAFRDLYGTNQNKKNAFGKCVSKLSKEKPAEQQQTAESTTDAATTCKAERASIGEEAFAAKYGTNKNKANAFGKCVSAQAKADDDAEETSSTTTTS